METKVILGIILSGLMIALWIFTYRKEGKPLRLLPYPLKYIGFLFIAAAIVLLLVNKSDHTVLFFYVGILGGLIVALSKERKEKSKDYVSIRKYAIFNTLKGLLPIFIVIGVLNITFFDTVSNEKEVTFSTPSTLFVFVMGYLMVFYSRKNKASGI